MKLKFVFQLVIFLNIVNLYSQQYFIKRDTLKEVIVMSNRITLPLKQNSQTISIITSDDIKKSAVTNVAELLQQSAGVDIRKRGMGGSQSDLYIRGGNYNQTLLLIDGIKMDDAQTGHHSMNAALPLEVIERIEIIKGPSARVFGQNAFTGAINIITKKNINNTISANIELGSFNQLNGSVTAGANLKNSSHIIHFGKLTSNGYRNNTDYDNSNYFIKSILNKKRLPVEMIISFFDRKFGAENFYTSSESYSEYEETQNSLVGVSATINYKKFIIKPRIYWRRNQDKYVFIRDNPSSHNFHINNKIGAEINSSYTSKIGVTGFGIDVSKVYLKSSALDDQNRLMTNLFLEHRFSLFNNKLDISPGIAANYFSDFKFNIFPGIDIGYQINDKLKTYANAGYTYRIPTYTELYISIANYLKGNSNLKPEKAISAEIGLKYSDKKFNAYATSFYRKTNNLIDYSKEKASTALLIANNIPIDISSKGIELNANYTFKINSISNRISTNYTFIDDDIKNIIETLELRYSVNSLRHQFTSKFSSQLTKSINLNIIYRHAERTSGNSYNIWDSSFLYKLNNLELTITVNNIFDAEYSEQGIILMPLSNALFGLRYNFN